MNKLIRTAKNSGIKAHIEREMSGWNKTQEIREGNRKTERKIGRVRTTYGLALTSLGATGLSLGGSGLQEYLCL